MIRGTSEDEGSALAWAICEEMMLKTARPLHNVEDYRYPERPFVLFTTHFPDLTQLANVYVNVKK